MSAGVSFLQTGYDDAPKNVGAYKAGNTDVIRQLLREQQKECSALHANDLFREFRGEKQKRFRGDKPQQELGKGGPMIDDFQAEGQARMFDLIKRTAIKEEKPLSGVWASFGKPYICLGDPIVPDNKLPALNRDDLKRAEGAKIASRGHKRRSNSQQQQQLQQSQQNDALSSTAAPPNTAGTRGRSGRKEDQLTPEEEKMVALSRNKSIMRFAPNDQLEASFPSGPLKQAAQRLTKCMARPGIFVNEREAEEEIADPFLAYGQPPVSARNLKPRGLNHSAVGTPEAVHRSTVFVTQGAETRVEDDARCNNNTFSEFGTHRPSSLGDQDDGQDDDAKSCVTSALHVGGGQGSQGPQNGVFIPLSSPTVPAKGDEDNPVYSWHNNFLRARQKGRASLQAALHERALGRYRARTIGPMAANLSSILMADLDLVQGKQLNYASQGVMPCSPYVKMDASWGALQERAANAARAAECLDPEEVRVLQRFYDQLCALVEAQRMSDPLSLMVVHTVKGLLENGTFLHRAMLVEVLKRLQDFSKSTGIWKHNKYLLSVLTFISKCAAVDETDFEALVHEHELSLVVYNSAMPPSIAAAEAAPKEGSNSRSPVRKTLANTAKNMKRPPGGSGGGAGNPLSPEARSPGAGANKKEGVPWQQQRQLSPPAPAPAPQAKERPGNATGAIGSMIGTDGNERDIKRILGMGISPPRSRSGLNPGVMANLA